MQDISELSSIYEYLMTLELSSPFLENLTGHRALKLLCQISRKLNCKRKLK